MIDRLILLIVGVTTITGCAAAPPGPRGPLLGPGIEIATDLSHAYGPGEETLSDGSFTSGGTDNVSSPLTIFPRRLEGRLSPVKWADIGGEIGWLGGGTDVRVGFPALEGNPLAGNLAAGIQTGDVGPFPYTKSLRSKWLRLEMYPRLPFWAQNYRLALAAGIHSGTFYHQLDDPRPVLLVDPPPGLRPTWIDVLRKETRLETSLGLLFSSPNRVGGSVLFTVSPYFVLDAGHPSTGCGGCATPPMSLGYRQEWGVVFVYRTALHLRF